MDKFLFIEALACFKVCGKAACMNAGISTATAKRCSRLAKQQR
jgi:hypothetical protein